MPLENPESNSSTMTLQCPSCLLIIPCGHNTKRHIRTLAGGKRHVCLICSKSYAYGNTLSANSQANEIEKPPNKCNRKEKSRLGPNVQVSAILKRMDLTDMNLYINAHTCEKSHVCSICSKSFSNRQALVEHLMTHTRDKPFKCSLCEYTSAFKNNLEKHVRVHKGMIPSKSLTKNVQNHVKVDSVMKVNKCRDYSSPSKNNLQSHLKCQTKKKPYKCVVCNYETTSRDHLNRHRRVHTGEKPYKCPLCPKWFSNISNSNRHKKTHTGVKPFKCLHCDYASMSRDGLYVHVTVHTREKPYKCPLCPKAFSNSSNSRRHLRLFHAGGKAVPTVLPKAGYTFNLPPL